MNDISGFPSTELMTSRRPDRPADRQVVRIIGDTAVALMFGQLVTAFIMARYDGSMDSFGSEAPSLAQKRFMQNSIAVRTWVPKPRASAFTGYIGNFHGSASQIIYTSLTGTLSVVTPTHP